MTVVARNARNLNVNRHQDHSQAWVLESTGLGSLESPIETRRGFTVRVARKEVRITLAPLDRETGPDLTWKWTLAVVVCAGGRL